MEDILIEFADKKLDLECIWLVYTILKLNPNYKLNDNLIGTLNETALVVYLHESSNAGEDLIERAASCGWLLNYELFFKNKIDADAMKQNLNTDDIKGYQYLVDNGINFYHSNKNYH